MFIVVAILGSRRQWVKIISAATLLNHVMLEARVQTGLQDGEMAMLVGEQIKRRADQSKLMDKFCNDCIWSPVLETVN